MSARDRLILFGLACAAVLGAVWMLAVSPARKQAAQASGELASAQVQLSQAQAEAAEARNAQHRYRKAYASLTSLGMAVPTSQEIPSLIYALDHAANHHKVEFSSITNGSASSSGSSTSAASSSASATSASTSAVSAFQQMPFTFVFAGSYSDLIHLLTNLEDFTVQSTDGSLRVNGRLLTIQGIQLGGGGNGGSSGQPAAGGANQSPNQMSWTITATAYTLGPSSPTAGPSAGSPSRGSATPTSSSGASGSAATPAVVKVGG